MADAKRELKEAVEEAIRNLKPVADRHPDSPVRADVFNMLLDQGKRLFPDSEIITALQPVTSGMTATDLMLRLSPLAGAINAAFRVEAAAVVGEAQQRNRERWGRGLLDR